MVEGPFSALCVVVLGHRFSLDLAVDTDPRCSAETAFVPLMSLARLMRCRASVVDGGSAPAGTR